MAEKGNKNIFIDVIANIINLDKLDELSNKINALKKATHQVNVEANVSNLKQIQNLNAALDAVQKNSLKGIDLRINQKSSHSLNSAKNNLSEISRVLNTINTNQGKVGFDKVFDKDLAKKKQEYLKVSGELQEAEGNRLEETIKLVQESYDNYYEKSTLKAKKRFAYLVDGIELQDFLKLDDQNFAVFDELGNRVSATFDDILKIKDKVVKDIGEENFLSLDMPSLDREIDSIDKKFIKVKNKHDKIQSSYEEASKKSIEQGELKDKNGGKLEATRDMHIKLVATNLKELRSSIENNPYKIKIDISNKDEINNLINNNVDKIKDTKNIKSKELESDKTLINKIENYDGSKFDYSKELMTSFISDFFKSNKAKMSKAQISNLHQLAKEAQKYSLLEKDNQITDGTILKQILNGYKKDVNENKINKILDDYNEYKKSLKSDKAKTKSSEPTKDNKPVDISFKYEDLEKLENKISELKKPIEIELKTNNALNALTELTKAMGALNEEKTTSSFSNISDSFGAGFKNIQDAIKAPSSLMDEMINKALTLKNTLENIGVTEFKDVDKLKKYIDKVIKTNQKQNKENKPNDILGSKKDEIKEAITSSKKSITNFKNNEDSLVFFQNSKQHSEELIASIKILQSELSNVDDLTPESAISKYEELIGKVKELKLINSNDNTKYNKQGALLDSELLLDSNINEVKDPNYIKEKLTEYFSKQGKEIYSINKQKDGMFNWDIGFKDGDNLEIVKVRLNDISNLYSTLNKESDKYAASIRMQAEEVKSLKGMLDEQGKKDVEAAELEQRKIELNKYKDEIKSTLKQADNNLKIYNDRKDSLRYFRDGETEAINISSDIQTLQNELRELDNLSLDEILSKLSQLKEKISSLKDITNIKNLEDSSRGKLDPFELILDSDIKNIEDYTDVQSKLISHFKEQGKVVESIKRNGNGAQDWDVIFRSGDELEKTKVHLEDISSLINKKNDATKKYAASVRVQSKSDDIFETTGQKWLSGLKHKMNNLTQYITGIEVVQRAWTEIKEGFSFVKDLDSLMTTIYQTSDITKTGLDELSQGAINQARNLGVATEQVSGAIEVYAAYGETVDSLLNKASPTTMLAKATGSDVKVASDQIQGVCVKPIYTAMYI